MPAVLKSVHSGPASMVICMSKSTSESQDEDSMRMCLGVCPTHQMLIECRCAIRVHTVMSVHATDASRAKVLKSVHASRVKERACK
jgi:hypothetical protein